ncbi:MAG: aminoacetone oxidase family FAD-binding enzyme [Lachnospiraceae bacterium]|nr:aminoacetone oxidase family FAD-binding enzyme [Lachnospiraceae bacterium]
MEKCYKTIGIIGGGAAGCMAAITAKRFAPEASVILFEGNDSVGKKILSTGNGRCNFTNSYQDISCYHSNKQSIVENALQAFSYENALQFFSDLGVLAVDREGYYYPMSNQATAIRHALLLEMQRLNIDIRTSARVFGVEDENRFLIRLEDESIPVDVCILTTGGKAAPTTGSDGSGLSFAKKLGHQIVPPVPSLVPLACKGHPLKDAAGVRVQATVGVMDPQGALHSDTGELQITKQGISGIPVFQISGVIARMLKEQLSPEISIRFWPLADAHEMRSFIIGRMKQGFHSPVDIFYGVLPEALITTLFPQMVEKDDVEHMISILMDYRVTISQTMGFGAAQTTSGGVSLTDIIDSTMESSLHKGLFFAGEILDVDGICGGYNLQWAWSSGYLAGFNAAQECL